MRGTPSAAGWRDALGREVRLVQSDIFDEDLSEGTVFFVASLSFPAPLMLRLAETLLELQAGTMVLSLGAFGGCHPGLAHIFEERIDLPAGDDVLAVHAYIVTPQQVVGGSPHASGWLSGVLIPDADADERVAAAWALAARQGEALCLEEFVSHVAEQRWAPASPQAGRLFRASIAFAVGSDGATVVECLTRPGGEWMLLHRQRGVYGSAVECGAAEWAWEVQANPLGLASSLSQGSALLRAEADGMPFAFHALSELALRPDDARAFISAVASVDVESLRLRDADGRSLLHLASDMGATSVLRELLLDADVGLMDEEL